VVIRLDQGADLHITQLMPLPLTISCSSKSDWSHHWLSSTGIKARIKEIMLFHQEFCGGERKG